MPQIPETPTPTIEDLAAQVIDLQQQIAELRLMSAARLLTTKQAALLLGVTARTLYSYQQQWREGVHYFPGLNGSNKGIRYNRELIEHWMQNRNSPRAHEKAIEKWLRQQKVK